MRDSEGCLMKKKVLWMLVAAAVLTGLMMLLATRMIPQKEADISSLQNEACIIYSDTVPETSLTGYEKEGTSLIPVNYDPQLYFDSWSYGQISGITLQFRSNVQERISVQVFYDNGTGITEENSCKSVCQAGMNRLDIRIPEGQYYLLRIDIDSGNKIPLETILAWDSEMIAAQAADFPWIQSGILLILLLAGMFMMSRDKTRWRRAGFILSVFAVSLYFVCMLKERLGITNAFDPTQIDKLLVSFSDVCLTALAIFWVLSFFRPIRNLFSIQGRIFTGAEKMLFALCFVVYCFWAFTFPSMSYGPDEYMRYDIPKYIYQTGMLPCGWEETIRNPIWGVSYGFDISLPYLISSWLMELMSMYSAADSMLLIAARMSSVLSGVDHLSSKQRIQQ